MQPSLDPNRFTRRAALIVIVLLVLMLGGLAFARSRFRVTGTSPALANITNVSATLTVNFNKTVSSSGLRVSATPANIVSGAKASGKRVIVELNYPLQTGKTLTITLNNITAADGEHIRGHTLTFVVANNPTPTPAESQQLLKKQDKVQGASSDPIVQHLPYTTLTFNLVANITAAGKLELDATLYLSEADMTNQTAAIAAYKQQVLDYIQSLNLNPASYNIVYTVSTP